MEERSKVYQKCRRKRLILPKGKEGNIHRHWGWYCAIAATGL